MRNALYLLLLSTVPVFANVPENLDRAAISDGVAKVKPKIQACGSTQTASGVVKVTVNVAPSGSVANASVKQSPDQKLGECVVAAMKSATFKQTKNGGSFSYPFVFGGSTGGTTPPPSSNSDELDRAAISEGVGKVKSDIMACGKGSTAKGTVKVKVDVAPEGTVKAALVQSTPDASLGACVSGVLTKATFKKTTKGGSFSYPFVF